MQVLSYLHRATQEDKTVAQLTAMQAELSRLEALTELQLLTVMEALDDDPAPEHIKDLILRKINSILNDRIGLS